MPRQELALVEVNLDETKFEIQVTTELTPKVKLLYCSRRTDCPLGPFFRLAENIRAWRFPGLLKINRLTQASPEPDRADEFL